jgi:hypothetical protein
MFSVTGMSWSRITDLKTSLSMQSAEASTPAPTYGTPASSSRPCTVPSSPNGPCSTGKTTSTPARVAAISLEGSRASSDPGEACNSLLLAGSSCQRPSRSIRTDTTSLPLRSSAPITLVAEAIEIGFSLERPPRITAMRRVTASWSS